DAVEQESPSQTKKDEADGVFLRRHLAGGVHMGNSIKELLHRHADSVQGCSSARENPLQVSTQRFYTHCQDENECDVLKRAVTFHFSCSKYGSAGSRIRRGALFGLGILNWELVIQRQVQFQNVDPLLAQKTELAFFGMLPNQLEEIAFRDAARLGY